ncbi:adenine phosphoribosyltransferase [Aureobasidium namibiae CBS 147.97]|uniref:adenine phosphoribosyltransferase n=1 Tax=Aureobasidium namibiae CBS 147.97 TaxID=1043004 RepID=A0A074WA57_9PEZI
MSGKPVSHDSHPPHGHPENQGPSEQNVDRASTASHPPSTKPDPTTTAPHPKLNPHGAKGVQSSSSSSGPAELADLKLRLRNALRQYPDFPSKGILFEDIMPIFSSPKLHSDLIKALELEVRAKFDKVPDVIVGLESRGFLFGPSLALRLDAGFVPVRKQGKLPGKLETEGYEKEYGTDFFQIQSDAIAKGQTVLVVDDIMATGGSAVAGGNLVKKIGGEIMGYLFLMELEFLHGRDKLDAPVVTLLSGQDAESREKEMPLGQTKESAEDVKSVQDAGGAAASKQP